MQRRHFLGILAATAAQSGLGADAPDAPHRLRKVHVVFKTHLDIGFTGQVSQVIDRYINHFIPKAMALARQMRERATTPGMVWTTGSWLIWEFLERADAPSRKRMEEAIAAGDIAWHALPVTLHSELTDPNHFRFGLGLSSKLDLRFGRHTIAGKMTDVPGHTRAIVPLLEEAGVQFLHIGVNPASAAPDVPALFRWQDPASSAAVDVAYAKGSYGDLTLLDGMDSALFIAMTGDNHGPQTPNDVEAVFAGLAKRFPGAQLLPARLDDFAADLAAHRARLPVIASELGDTWIHGVGSDPKLVHAYRSLSQQAAEWHASSTGQPHREVLETCLRRLLLLPEHTWGLDEKTFLNDFTHWDKPSFHSLRQKEKYQLLQQSWADKRGHLDLAVRMLKDTPWHESAAECVAPATLEGRMPDRDALPQSPDVRKVFEGPWFRLRFAASGALDYLEHTSSGRVVAGPENPLALFHYEVFPLAAFQQFYRQYVIADVDWARRDLGKVCVPEAEAAYAAAVPEGRTWHPQVESIHEQQGAETHSVRVRMRGPVDACNTFGCPRVLCLSMTQHKSNKNRLVIEFLCAQKDAVRTGEALWLSFAPLAAGEGEWVFYKMGRAISPLDVIPGGNQTLHAVLPGVEHRHAGRTLRIESPTTPLCAPGKPMLLQFGPEKPDLSGGVHFNLQNNVWGTNFRSWYDEPMRHMFHLSLA